MKNPALYSSHHPHWSTPSSLYVELDKEFHFTLDPCPLGATGGLERSWEDERVFCNPPYGRSVIRWLEKAHEAEIAVYLLPARTDTRWFHDCVLGVAEIRFVRGRIYFEEGGRSVDRAPFPSLIAVFR